MNTLTKTSSILDSLINQNNTDYFKDFLNNVKNFSMQLGEKTLFTKLDSDGSDCENTGNLCSVIEIIDFDSDKEEQIPINFFENYMSDNHPENIILKSAIGNALKNTRKQAEYIFGQSIK